LRGGYREKLTGALREPGVIDENGTGSVNNNVKVTFFTTSRCSQRRALFSVEEEAPDQDCIPGEHACDEAGGERQQRFYGKRRSFEAVSAEDRA
jgi:hypothetical protein